jgi:hypothetical protein
VTFSNFIAPALKFLDGYKPDLPQPDHANVRRDVLIKRCGTHPKRCRGLGACKGDARNFLYFNLTHCWP